MVDNVHELVVCLHIAEIFTDVISLHPRSDSSPSLHFTSYLVCLLRRSLLIMQDLLSNSIERLIFRAMPPNQLFDTYRAYKAGTQKLATWLINTAKRVCASAVPSYLSGPPVIDAGARLISVSDFTDLSGAIANTLSKVEVPTSVLNITKDITASRQRCADWYSRSGSTVDIATQKSNAGAPPFHCRTFERPRPAREERRTCLPSRKVEAEQTARHLRRCRCYHYSRQLFRASRGRGAR